MSIICNQAISCAITQVICKCMRGTLGSMRSPAARELGGAITALGNGSGPNATYLASRTGTGSHYGTCMHRGRRTRLPGSRHGNAGGEDRRRGELPGSAGRIAGSRTPAGPGRPTVSSRMP
jgi:hypothetical protein